MPSSTDLPARVVNVELARRRYGDRADELLAGLWQADPLADQVVDAMHEQPGVRATFDRVLTHGRTRGEVLPAALERFFDHVEAVPGWVDWARVDRAGALFFRTGLPGGIILGAKSLCHGYCSPGGNKPLVMTGRLEGNSLAMRLAETGRYVVETCRSGGLRRHAPGYVITLRVRIMHAAVRRLLRRSDGWRDDRWGLPINQHDMLGTALLFSLSFIEGARQFGFSVSEREAEDYLHLWRYASHLMGVDEASYPADEREARVLADIIMLTQGAPDGDSRKLVDALVRAPEQQARDERQRRRAAPQVAAAYGFCRTLLGEELADALDLPRDGWRFAIPVASRLVAAVEPFRRRVPYLERQLLDAGHRYWQRTIDEGRKGKRTTFTPPTQLADTAARA
jgi:hypothetical protein